MLTINIQKIKITKYTEGENLVVEKTGVKDICEIIISQNVKNMIQSRKIIEKTL